MLFTLVLLTCLAVQAVGRVPTVKLDDATVIGTSDGVTTSFLGIPFAKAPYVLVKHSCTEILH